VLAAMKQGEEIQRLQQLVLEDPIKASQDPIWQLLHLEDKNFLRKLPGLLKLHLLGLALLSEEDREALRERLSGIDISVDAFEIESTDYDEADCILESEIEIEGYCIKIFCYNTSAEMEDVEECCERLPLADTIIGYLEDKDQDLQEFAGACDIEYEPCMSPSDGYPMRPGGISIESNTGFWEFEHCSFPDDAPLINILSKEGDLYILGIEHATSDKQRLLFSSAPSWDDEHGLEGSITASWNCDSYVPVDGANERQYQYKKVSINEDLAFSGNSTYDYTIKYRYEKVGDLETELATKLLKANVSKLIEDLLLRVLGLSD
jgi:hypothetical protein